MRGGYRIIDEPGPSALEQVIVNPIWPLFASMFAGPWLAFPWFVLNSFALGGRRRFVDLAIAVGGFVLSGLLLISIGLLLSKLVLDERSLTYAQLGPISVRLVVMYLLFLRQEQTFELYTHFGGKTRNALFVVIAGALLKSRLLGGVSPFWQALLG